MTNPFQVVRDLEQAISKYTGAPYVVTTNSCTMALLLACKWYFKANSKLVNIPKRTYVGVPMSIINAGGAVRWRDEDWLGAYRLRPSPIWDSARYFSGGMYIAKQFQCVSFHATKILGDTQGGAILHDNPEADAWFRRMRFDGRTEGVAPKDDHFEEIGFHCYMSPDVAARLFYKLSALPKHNEPLPNDDYPDLSLYSVFR